LILRFNRSFFFFHFFFLAMVEIRGIRQSPMSFGNQPKNLLLSEQSQIITHGKKRRRSGLWSAILWSAG
jgi:hypothetical protein